MWDIVIMFIDVLFITLALLWIRANNSRIEKRFAELQMLVADLKKQIRDIEEKPER